MLEVAVLTVLPGAVAFAAAMDLFTMKIPNRISAVMVLAFFPLALLAGLGAWDILDHVAAGLSCCCSACCCSSPAGSAAAMPS